MAFIGQYNRCAIWQDLRGYGPILKGQQAARLIVNGAYPQSISLKAGLHALAKRMRMAQSPKVRADLSAPTCRARAIRVLSKALSSQASEHKFESQLDATRVVRLVEKVRELGSKLHVKPLLDLRVFEDGEVYVIVRLHAQVREPQRECAKVVGKLEPAVPIEADRTNRRPRAGRRVVRELARVVETNPHRLSVGVSDYYRVSVVIFCAQRYEAGVVDPLRQRLLVRRNDEVLEVAVVDVIPPTERRPTLIGVDTLYLPAADDPRHDSVGTGQELTAFPERQFVNRAQREPVRVVRIRDHFGRQRIGRVQVFGGLHEP